MYEFIRQIEAGVEIDRRRQNEIAPQRYFVKHF